MQSGSARRELPSILDAGYALSRVQAVDMFPHTTHIETVVHSSGDRRHAARASQESAELDRHDGPIDLQSLHVLQIGP